MTIPTFREVEDHAGQLLRTRGGLGAILIDLTPLARIERRFGGAIYQSLRAQIDPLMVEMRSRFRDPDILARDEREGDRFLVFVDLGDRRTRKASSPWQTCASWPSGRTRRWRPAWRG